MKQLTVVSGKGGTGKTSLVASFAALSEDTVFADCDVDAADLHLILKPEIVKEEEFKALKTAELDESRCVRCGLCIENCRFDAIHEFKINPLTCEGCGVCEYICPQKAITMSEKV